MYRLKLGRINRAAKRGREGYTLPEVLISMGIVGIMVAVLYGGLTVGTFQSQFAQEDLRATQIMMEKLEVVRSYTWNQFFPNIDPDESDEDEGETFDSDDPDIPQDDIPFSIPNTFTASFIPGATNSGGFQYTGKIYVYPAPITEAYSNSLAAVVVQVEWVSGGKRHTREMRSFFAEFGMQNNLTR